MSPVTAESILTVRARSAPFPWLLIAGSLLGLVLLGLLVVVVLRGGNKNKRRPAGAPAAGAAQPYTAPGMPGPAPHSPALPPPPPNPSRAVLQGAGGVFTVVPGLEMRVGRDSATCAILLSEPQVSSFHASVKMEGGQAFVRDENSNNGTYIQGVRIAASAWAPVPHGASLRFGPDEFTLRLE